MSSNLELFPSSVHDPGGKVYMRLPSGTTGSAVFGGENQEYRYRLERCWDASKPTIMFLMMNPSIGNPEFDDPTLAKCGRYARRWGYGRLLVGNTFAYRATNQKYLCSVSDPFGWENTDHLIAMASESDKIIFAYGKPHVSLRVWAEAEARFLVKTFPEKAHVLKLCMDGTPTHPLYLKEDLQPVRWVI